MIDLLEELVMLHGVTGYEDRVREAVRQHLGRYAAAGRTDRLGNLYVTVGSGSPHLVAAAHMDEIGLIITHIEQRGTLRFTIIGGLDRRILPGRIVQIDTGSDIIEGIIGLTPPHLMAGDGDRNRIIEPEEMVIDVGAESREEAEALGISVRDPVVLKKDFIRLSSGYLSARSLDDRAGCAILLTALKRLEPGGFRGRVTFAWTVQEEVGLRGATALASALDADICIPLDTLSSADIPGVPFHRSPALPGKGPALRFLDRRALATPRLVDAVVGLAGRRGIPVQVAHTGGGTDGSAFQLEGAAMVPIAFPMRYTHSPVEMLHLSDLENAVELLVEIIANLESIDEALR